MNNPIETYRLPARWAPYLLNRDQDSVTDVVESMEWQAKNPELERCLACSDTPFFAHANDAGTVPPGGDCLEFAFSVLAGR